MYFETALITLIIPYLDYRSDQHTADCPEGQELNEEAGLCVLEEQPAEQPEQTAEEPEQEQSQVEEPEQQSFEEGDTAEDNAGSEDNDDDEND